VMSMLTLWNKSFSCPPHAGFDEVNILVNMHTSGLTFGAELPDIAMGQHVTLDTVGMFGGLPEASGKATLGVMAYMSLEAGESPATGNVVRFLINIEQLNNGDLFLGGAMVGDWNGWACAHAHKARAHTRSNSH